MTDKRMSREDFLKAIKLEEQMKQEKADFERAYKSDEPSLKFDAYIPEEIPDIRTLPKQGGCGLGGEGECFEELVEKIDSRTSDDLLREMVHLLKLMREDLELVRLHTECISTTVMLNRETNEALKKWEKGRELERRHQEAQKAAEEKNLSLDSSE